MLAAKAYQRVSCSSDPAVCRPRCSSVEDEAEKRVMKNIVFGVAAALLGGAVAWAQPATTKLDSVAGVPNIDSSTQTQDVKFRNEQDDRMTVPVRLSGAGPYRFLVDTGADRTAVSREIADHLNLKSAG